MTKADDTKQAATHTPEPWKISQSPEMMENALVIYHEHEDGYKGHIVTTLIDPAHYKKCKNFSPEEQIANARRICAAVNACKGISTESLEQGVVRQFVEALEDLYNWLTPDWKQSSLGDKARTAIAKATGMAV